MYKFCVFGGFWVSNVSSTKVELADLKSSGRIFNHACVDGFTKERAQFQLSFLILHDVVVLFGVVTFRLHSSNTADTNALWIISSKRKMDFVISKKGRVSRSYCCMASLVR